MALTKQDLGQIKKVVDKSVDKALDRRDVATKDDLKNFATKENLDEVEARLTGEIRQVGLDVVQTRAAFLQRA